MDGPVLHVRAVLDQEPPAPRTRIGELTWAGDAQRAGTIADWLRHDFAPAPGEAFPLDFYESFHGVETGPAPPDARAAAARHPRPRRARARGIRAAIEALGATSLDLDSEWQRIAPIHTDWCLHYQEAFLPWHRANLLYFEQRLGMPIPYWNFMAPDASVDGAPGTGLPQPFKDETYIHPRTGEERPNPLRFAVARHGHSKAGDSAYVQRDPLLYTSGDEQRAERVAKLEHLAHYTAYDPVFWSYHANIDRVFETWLRAHPAATFTAGFPLRPFAGTRAHAVDFTNPERWTYTTIGDLARARLRLHRPGRPRRRRWSRRPRPRRTSTSSSPVSAACSRRTRSTCLWGWRRRRSRTAPARTTSAG